MQRIPLDSIPNQAFSVRLEGAYYDITIRALNDEVMTISIVRDGVPVVHNTRAVPLMTVIPYSYREAHYGNFVWHTADGDYPYYTRFGSTDALFFATDAELEEVRRGRGH